jgi:excisionase family DNA binding protein
MRGTNPYRAQKRLFDVNAAAEYLGCSPWRVRTAVWIGELPSVRWRKRVMLDLADLDAFIDSHKHRESVD